MTPPRGPRHALAAWGTVAGLLGLCGTASSVACADDRRAPPAASRPEERVRGREPATDKPPSREHGMKQREEAQAPRAERGGPRLAHVPLSRLEVTQGRLGPGEDGRLTVDAPRMRAVAPGTTATAAELRFTVLGPTREQRALGSGAQRQQVGLKLRALDGCNLLYVMWRLAPKPGIVVNYKRNPGQRTSRECGNDGYTTVRPSAGKRVEAPAPGTPHTLRAALDGRTLRVWADDTLAWEGELPDEALALEGPVGVRSDNVRLALQLYAPLP
ncbi:hypothetical protein [Pyxidicoccus xibeiensis]|uniref:hypothetical protein n=1 Tax=Pyxidicoccus xibeiensis TaxID=2906759 RepID=UPI0020A80A8E|nr:hypothetical protein [Pyxidicoccus xibeiensis]MCP3141912.1 hypothetical protein [Pyxidicoccus xibeiensis]